VREAPTGSWATEYFRRDGTVSTWWDPLSEDDPAFRDWFLGQLDDVVAACAPQGKKVLDAATGRGRAAVACAAAGARQVVGVDISEDMLDRARALAAESAVEQATSFVQADLEQLPFGDQEFDAALLLETLLHLEGPDRVLAELGRVLQPGGRLFVTTNGANPLARLVQPGTRGAHGTPRWKLAAATAVNELMSAAFGFTWRRTPATARLYARFFNAPVRPLYPWRVRRMMADAGFATVYQRSVPGPLLPREHRWLAIKGSGHLP
jgi:ubiquinone/menaquinone biosynthesis C-methylase UbiE